MNGTRFLALTIAGAAILLAVGWSLPSWAFVIAIAISCARASTSRSGTAAGSTLDGGPAHTTRAGSGSSADNAGAVGII